MKLLLLLPGGLSDRCSLLIEDIVIVAPRRAKWSLLPAEGGPCYRFFLKTKGKVLLPVIPALRPRKAFRLLLPAQGGPCDRCSPARKGLWIAAPCSRRALWSLLPSQEGPSDCCSLLKEGHVIEAPCKLRPCDRSSLLAKGALIAALWWRKARQSLFHGEGLSFI